MLGGPVQYGQQANPAATQATGAGIAGGMVSPGMQDYLRKRYGGKIAPGDVPGVSQGPMGQPLQAPPPQTGPGSPDMLPPGQGGLEQNMQIRQDMGGQNPNNPNSTDAIRSKLPKQRNQMRQRFPAYNSSWRA